MQRLDNVRTRVVLVAVLGIALVLSHNSLSQSQQPERKFPKSRLTELLIPKELIFGDCRSTGDPNGMWLLDSMGATLQHVSNREGMASWASDGIRVVVVDPKRRLKVLRIDKPGVSYIINLPEGLDPSFPMWSPTEDIIAFQSKDANSIMQLYLVNADSLGSGFRQLTSDTVPSAFPTWQPDGKRLLFTGTVNRSDAALYHLALDGSKPELFYPPDSMQLVNASYTPDGKYIVASARGSGNLVRIDADGKHPINITRVGNPQYPFAFPRFGKSSEYFICSGRRPGMPSMELFKFAVDGSFFRILTDKDDTLSWTYGAPNK